MAIWLSIYFYDKGKNSERLIAGALEAIKAQTEALQRLTGRWMDRLTRYATEPRPADETLVVLLQAFREMPANLATAFRAPAPDANVPALRREILVGYVATYYHVTLSNVLAQGYLPQDRAAANPALVQLINDTAQASRMLTKNLANVEQPAIQATGIAHLHARAVEAQQALKNTGEVYRAREAG